MSLVRRPGLPIFYTYYNAFPISHFFCIILRFFITGVVFANTLYPELNHGFEAVYSVKDIKGNDLESHFFGFCIIQEVDARWVSTFDPNSGEPDPFRCRIVAPNCLEFTMPGPSYALLNDRDNFCLTVEKFALNAIDNDVHKYAADRAATGLNKRKYKKVLLVFPEFVELNSQQIFQHEAHEDKSSIFPESFADKYQTDIRTTNFKHYFIWKVARIDIGSEKHGKWDQKPAYSRMQMAFGITPPAQPPAPPGGAAGGSSGGGGTGPAPMQTGSTARGTGNWQPAPPGPTQQQQERKPAFPPVGADSEDEEEEEVKKDDAFDPTRVVQDVNRNLMHAEMELEFMTGGTLKKRKQEEIEK